MNGLRRVPGNGTANAYRVVLHLLRRNWAQRSDDGGLSSL